MKTFKECQDWLREKNLLNKFYCNFYTQMWDDAYSTPEDVYRDRESDFITASFEWCRTPEESNGISFWCDIHREFKLWF